MKKILILLLFLPALLEAQIKDRTKQFDHVTKVTAPTVSTPDSSTNIANTAWVKRQLYGSGGGGSSNPFADNTDLLKNSSDNTKLFRISLSGLTTGTTRTWTLPDVNGTFARNDAAQSFTGVQTFASAPIFSSLATSGGIHYGNGSGAVLQTGAGTSTTLLHGGTSPAYSGVAVADLTATGTPSSTTFLRGDNTWSTPSASGSFLVGGNTYGGTVVFGGLDNNHLDIKANNVIVGRINAAGEFIWTGGGTLTDNGAYPVQLEGRTWYNKSSGNTINANTDGVNDDVATYHWSINSNSLPNTVWTTPSNTFTWLVRDYTTTTNLLTLGGDNTLYGINHLAAFTSTSISTFAFKATNAFAPASGSVTSTSFEDDGTVNQTGGTSIARSFWAHKTCTACLDYRAFENANGTNLFNQTSGNTGIGISSAPAARLHLGAGTATASTAPLKFSSGTNLTSAEAGAFEYNGTSLFFSPSTTRLRTVLTDNSIPSNGQIPIGNGTNYTNASITSTGSTITITPGAGTINLEVPASVASSGTYTATLTGILNVDGTGFVKAFYTRVGNFVTVTMHITVNPTAASAVAVDISLPIASNFASSFDLLGHGTCVSIPAQTVTINANTTDDRATLSFIATDVNTQGFYFSFTYQII
jgi:hypothetical protein